MSSIFKRLGKTKRDYKKLYEIELNNRKLFEKRCKELRKEKADLEKSSGIADLRIEIKKLTIELQDTSGLLRNEQIANEVLIERQKIVKGLLKKSNSKNSSMCLEYLEGKYDEDILSNLYPIGDKQDGK